jgi:transposase
VDIVHETDVELLRQKAQCLLQENERLSKKVVEQAREILQLKGMSPDQLQKVLALLDEELNRVKAATESSAPTEQGAKAAEPKKRAPQRGHGPHPQPSLPIETVVDDLDEADKICPDCGGELVLWPGQDDETEEIDVVERRFVLRKRVRKKRRCRCGHIEMPDLPERLVPGGRYSNDFAVEVAIDKYENHLPLERQRKAMGGQGLVVNTQTLWDQIDALARKLAPASERLREQGLRDLVLGFDETRWEVLTKGSASRKSWAMWQLSTRTIVYFAIAADHDSETGKKFLDGFSGIAIGDAATVHKSMVKQAPYRLAFCWAHARRNFEKAEASDAIRARQFLDMVKDLYAVEKLAPPGPDGDELRKKLRDEQSRPITKKIQAWIMEQRVLPGSDIAQAMQYVAKQWVGLCVFLDEPQVPLDNNRTERGFRGPALGRHNFYGSRSRRGTEVAAILYSLVESAKLNGLVPKAYLKTALAAALEGKVIPLPHELT